MAETAKLIYNGKEYEIPIVTGTEDEKALDISSLRGSSGAITLDEGFVNTGATLSGVTFLDGEKGILRYRGYPIEQLAEKSSFLEVAYLLIYGELPSREEFEDHEVAGNLTFGSWCAHCVKSKGQEAVNEEWGGSLGVH